MIPSTFDYHAPKTLKSALRLLDEHEDAKLLAGGHSLLPLMKFRFAAPPVLVDIGKVPGMGRIRISKGVIEIGALVTHDTIATNARLKRVCPVLPETAIEIGDAQVRNRGTIGGSIVHADPAADWPAALLALDAEFDLVGRESERTVKAADFFLDMMTTDLGEGEILKQVNIPEPPDRSGSAYAKMHQSASGFAVAGVAARVTLDESGSVASIGVGVTGVAPKPYRAAAVENALRGRTPDASAIAEAGSAAAEDADDFNEDHHASGDYRKHLAAVYAERALTSAVERAS